MYCDDAINRYDRSDYTLVGWRYWITGALLAALSIAIFLINTRHGIGIYPDTTRYMGINELPYDAPIYAWLVQVWPIFGIGMTTGAKALGLVFVCANTLLVWSLLVRATGMLEYAALGTALIILAPQFVTLHSLAMSEAPFLFLLLLVVQLSLRYFDTDNRAWLVLSAVALGLATLTRFTAPPMGAAVAVCLLFDQSRHFNRRAADALIYAGVSASIFLGWTAISHLEKGHSIGRELSFYGNMGAKQWLNSLETLTAWLLPDEIPFAIRVMVLCLFIAAATSLIIVDMHRAFGRGEAEPVGNRYLPAMFGLFIVFYMAFMVLATSIEANLSLNGRYAFPTYVMTVMALTIVVANSPEMRGLPRFFRYGLVALAVLVLVSHAFRTATRSLDAYASGIGFASLEWINSPTMLAARALPQSALVYSNGADAIAYVLQRPAYFIPQRFELRTGIEKPSRPFEKQVQQVIDAAAGRPAYIVMFDKVTWRFYRATESELIQHLPLVNVAATADGRIYAVRPVVVED